MDNRESGTVPESSSHIANFRREHPNYGITENNTSSPINIPQLPNDQTLPASSSSSSHSSPTTTCAPRKKHVHVITTDEEGNIVSSDYCILRSGGNKNYDEDSEELKAFPEATIFDLNFAQKLAVASGHFLNDICASMWFSYYLMYAQKVVGFSSNYAAGLLFLGQMVDAFATPLVGYEADQGFGQNDYWPCRSPFGRYKSWHLLGILMSTVSFPFLFSPVIGLAADVDTEWVKALYYAPFIIIYEAGWASTQIAHLALIPKVNPDVLVRTEILAMRFLLTVVANIALFLMISFVLGFSEDCVVDQSDSYQFMEVALITITLGAVCTVIFYLVVKEYPDERVKLAVHQWTQRERFRKSKTATKEQTGEKYNSSDGSTESRQSHDSEINEQEQTRKRSSSNSYPDSPLFPVLRKRSHEMPFSFPLEGSLPDTSQFSIVQKFSTKKLNYGATDMMPAKDWMKLPQLYLVAAVYISSRLVINVPQAYMPLYLQETLHLSCSAIALIPMTYFLAGFFVATVIKTVNKYFGRQVSFILGTVLNFIGAAVVQYGDWSPEGFLHSQGIYIIFAILGGGATVGMITSLSITADMIGNNVESGAFVYGIMSFCDKMSCGLIVLLINSLSPQRLTAIPSKETEEFYRAVMSYSNIACSLFGIFGVIALSVLIHHNNKLTKKNGGGSPSRSDDTESDNASLISS